MKFGMAIEDLKMKMKMKMQMKMRANKRKQKSIKKLIFCFSTHVFKVVPALGEQQKNCL
jgi:hypothetical protein